MTRNYRISVVVAVAIAVVVVGVYCLIAFTGIELPMPMSGPEIRLNSDAPAHTADPPKERFPR